MSKCDFNKVASIKLLCNFIEITLRHGCSPVNLVHIFRTLLAKNTSWWLLLYVNTLFSVNILPLINEQNIVTKESYCIIDRIVLKPKVGYF